MDRKLKLAVVYPWGIDQGWTKSFHSMLRLRHPPDCEIEWGRGSGWCSAARHNHCFRQALNWGADLILVIGADQVYHDRDMLCKFVEHFRNGHECLTALVPMRGYMASQGTKPFHLVGWRVKRDADGNTKMHEGMNAEDAELVTREDGPLVRVQAVGTGVLMFPADVLRSMSTPWCVEIPTQPDFDRGSTADVGFVEKLQTEARLEIMCDTTVKVTHLHTFEIDDSFSERFKDWADGGGDPWLCDYKPAPNPKEIRQARASPAIPFYKERFLSRYGLVDYADPNRPAFFFGLYGTPDFEALNSHVGPAVVIWTGSDVLAIREWCAKGGQVQFGSNVHHVAISQFIADDLDALGLKYVRLPFCCVDGEKFKPVPLGRKVYCYCPDHARDKYGGPLLDEIMRLLPDVEFHVQRTLDPAADMPAIYAECAMNLRLVRHDGLSNTSMEMGLSGRPTINAGDFGWDAQKIADAIRASEPVPERVAQDTRDFLTMPEGWNTVAYYASGAPVATSQGIISPELLAKPYDPKEYFDWRYLAGPLGAGGPNPSSLEASWTRDQITRLIRDNDCHCVLDVGCGSMARWDHLPSVNYTGVDISQTALQHARLRFPDANFNFADVSTDDLQNYQADAVISIDMAQHIPHADFQSVVDRLFAAARKLVVIKTSVGINESHYQFSHSWATVCPDGWFKCVVRVPDTPNGVLLIFEKAEICGATRTNVFPHGAASAPSSNDNRAGAAAFSSLETV